MDGEGSVGKKDETYVATDDTSGPARKKPRRVSFADITHVHIFDREDSSTVSGGSRDEGDGERMEPAFPSPILKVLRDPDDDDNSPFHMGEEAATPTDEGHYFGPIQPWHIAPGLTNQTPTGEDKTMDSVTFSRELMKIKLEHNKYANVTNTTEFYTRTIDAADMKTPVENSLSHSAGRKMILTTVKAPVARQLRIDDRTSDSFSDMSFLEEKKSQYDYGEMPPDLKSLLEQKQQELQPPTFQSPRESIEHSMPITAGFLNCNLEEEEKLRSKGNEELESFSENYSKDEDIKMAGTLENAASPNPIMILTKDGSSVPTTCINCHDKGIDSPSSKLGSDKSFVVSHNMNETVLNRENEVASITQHAENGFVEEKHKAPEGNKKVNEKFPSEEQEAFRIVKREAETLLAEKNKGLSHELGKTHENESDLHNAVDHISKVTDTNEYRMESLVEGSGHINSVSSEKATKVMNGVLTVENKNQVAELVSVGKNESVKLDGSEAQNFASSALILKSQEEASLNPTEGKQDGSSYPTGREVINSATVTALGDSSGKYENDLEASKLKGEKEVQVHESSDLWPQLNMPSVKKPKNLQECLEFLFIQQPQVHFLQDIVKQHQNHMGKHDLRKYQQQKVKEKGLSLQEREKRSSLHNRVAYVKWLHQVLIYEKSKLSLIQRRQEELKKIYRDLDSARSDFRNLETFYKQKQNVESELSVTKCKPRFNSESESYIKFLELELKNQAERFSIKRKSMEEKMAKIKKENQRASEEVITMRQELKVIESKSDVMCEFYCEYLNVGQKLSTEEVLKVIEDNLKHKSSISCWHQQMQSWRIKGLKNDARDCSIELSYGDILFQRFIFEGDSYDGHAVVSLSLNRDVIEKKFSIANALELFSIVFPSSKSWTVDSAKNIWHVVTETGFLYGTVVSVLEELQSCYARLKIPNSAEFSSGNTHALSLQLRFINPATGLKGKISLGVGSILRGVYPFDTLPHEVIIEEHKVTPNSNPLSEDVIEAVNNMKPGYFRLKSICECISKLAESRK